MEPRSPTRVGAGALVSLAAATMLAAAGPLAGPAAAAISFGVGTDYATGPGKQSVRDVLAYAQSVWPRADVTVAAARFNSSQVGIGTNATAALTWAVSPKLSLQVVGGRAVAEADYRSTRFQLGPIIPVRGGTWGVFYTRADDTFGSSTAGLTTEVGLPLSPSMIAIGRGSLASVEGGGTNLQGSAGLIWGASKRVLFVTEAGLGRDATALSASAPAQGGIGITGREAGQGYVSGPALSLGIRYVIR